MDVTFASSGALSRAHYSIVRKVETAPSPQQADQLSALEIKSVHERLSGSSLSVKECKASLVILLYISAAASPGFLRTGTFDFALAHALNLAEIGKTIEDKRIGYLFCAELMPPHHELRLMMVNTLRKDLESGSPGRMCLALDNLITFANEDVLPAVQDVILDLLSHNQSVGGCPQIRRRAVLALRSLSVYDPMLLSRGSNTLNKRLYDRNASVVGSALAAAAGLPTSDANYSNVRHAVNTLFSSIGISSGSAMTLRILLCLQNLGLSEGNVAFALDLVKSFSSSGKPASLLGVFRLLSQHSPNKLIEAEKAQNLSTVRCVQDHLASHDVNNQYLYLACLLCMDPGVWAGTSPDHPLVLDAWEVERIMQFLESPDDLIRKMTLNLLVRIDPSILSTYLTRVMEGMRLGLDLGTLNLFTIRMLDVIVVLSSEDGERFAQGTKQVLNSMDKILDRPRVLEGAVEKVLIHVRAGKANKLALAGSDFRLSCATTLLTYLVDSVGSLGPTFLVISAALAVESIASVSISPSELLKVFSASLKTTTPIVQDASLLAILRLVAEADTAALDVAKQAVEWLQQRAGPRIKKRCTQVLNYADNGAALRGIIQSLVSQTLPEFLEALERPRVSQMEGNAASSHRALRYAAYERPPPVTSRWRSRSSSVRSDSTSERRASLQESAQTVSLSLAAVSLGLEVDGKSEPESARSDLISLDSPFASMPDDFEQIWKQLPDESQTRGWCEASLAEVLGQVQAVAGAQARVARKGAAEARVVVTRGGETAAMVLKASDEEGCLWRLKLEGGGLGHAVISGVGMAGAAIRMQNLRRQGCTQPNL